MREEEKNKRRRKLTSHSANRAPTPTVYGYGREVYTLFDHADSYTAPQQSAHTNPLS
ncbi:predicted protein [Botrytis cinerea T4]|uniref:Uncharacterized protein n=1 Tax=Botryotinia fuckeliana (strain T4) TaxID=999810 RepID=G2XNP6_BOTF4|nr:predicted protein [Botrytis cinerea T4]